MCRLYGKFASYLRRVLCKTRLIFPRINGPIKFGTIHILIHQVPTAAIKDTADLLTEHRKLTPPPTPVENCLLVCRVTKISPARVASGLTGLFVCLLQAAGYPRRAYFRLPDTA